MFEKALSQNMEALKNAFPGSGIIVGMSPDAKNFVQVYWLAGRTENNSNLIFVDKNGFIKTQAFDASKMVEPSLIFYPAKNFGKYHIVSNGEQTEAIINSLLIEETFEDALYHLQLDPQTPTFTPKISCIINLEDKKNVYQISCSTNFFNYEQAIPGIGHCIHTYVCDTSPCFSFKGKPFIVRLFDDIDETSDFYWNILPKDIKVSIFAKFVNIETRHFQIRVKNEAR